MLVKIPYKFISLFMSKNYRALLPTLCGNLMQPYERRKVSWSILRQKSVSARGGGGVSQHALGRGCLPKCMLGYTHPTVDRSLDTRFWKHYLSATMLQMVIIVAYLLLPANKVCKGHVFTGVCLSTGGMHGGGMHGRGACMAGGHAWQGGMHGRGHAWGCAWQGACLGGMHGRGLVWQGGICDRGSLCGRGACMAGVYMPCTPWQILWDTVNERAVRILLECILVLVVFVTTNLWIKSDCVIPNDSIHSNELLTKLD